MRKQSRTAAAAHFFVILTLAIGAFIAAPAAAQSITGTILGNGTDGDGLALPGATVTATNTETGATRTVVTDSEGSYLIGALQIGLYRVDVSMSGFRSFQQEQRSEEHTSELQSPCNLVCRLPLVNRNVHYIEI